MAPVDPVVQAFEAALPAGRAIPDDVSDRVARVFDAARSAFPELEVDRLELARHLGKHVHDEPAWERLRPAEFALCLACGRGSRAGLARFEALFEPTLRAALRRFATANVPADELSQLLRERLFVGNGAPRILEYSGQGFLENWLRVTAVRTFTDAVRSGPKREVPLPEGLLEAESGDDVELAYLKTHYREALKQAFERAVNGLDGGSRNLLRQSVVQRLTIDQIGALYGIHRATAARRVEKAKADLLAATRARLMEQLHVEETELDSIMNLVRSRFDLSVGRVLSSGDE